MSSLLNPIQSKHMAAAAALSLEARAEQAGAAWACLYSSSAEYDAALIAERRAAGVYGPKRQRRNILIACAGIAAGLAVIVAAIQAIS
ncbi:MAG: hypothetical protein WC670_20670 [Pseudolabrys sp.]|jgi:hypothetical protein